MVRIPDDSTDSSQSTRVHELSWAILDEQIADNEMMELESLLINNQSARKAYIDCVMLHADLTSHFASQPISTPTSSKSPVLGFLNEAMPPIGLPSAEELK